jgi:hypothetical protein
MGSYNMPRELSPGQSLDPRDNFMRMPLYPNWSYEAYPFRVNLDDHPGIGAHIDLMLKGIHPGVIDKARVDHDGNVKDSGLEHS